ncbi:translation initiation factor 2 [Lysinibacillus fusiformis]|nr:translation initiation factor 2 [Lysinibacillus fusiformis]
MNDYKKNPQQSLDTTEIQIARLAYIGASISTLGDGLSAVAAGLALNALEKSSNQNPQNQNNDQSKGSEDMQKQIDYLINELKQVKKMMR